MRPRWDNRKISSHSCASVYFKVTFLLPAPSSLLKLFIAIVDRVFQLLIPFILFCRNLATNLISDVPNGLLSDLLHLEVM